MNRDDQEMALWTAEYVAARAVSAASASCAADEAVAQFRKRYPPQPVAPEAVWHDEPPFEKDGEVHYCWVVGCSDPHSVYWSTSSRGWCYFSGNTPIHPLNGRRVSPIAKPPEPTT